MSEQQEIRKPTFESPFVEKMAAALAEKASRTDRIEIAYVMLGLGLASIPEELLLDFHREAVVAIEAIPGDLRTGALLVLATLILEQIRPSVTMSEADGSH